jgi:surface protein
MKLISLQSIVLLLSATTAVARDVDVYLRQDTRRSSVIDEQHLINGDMGFQIGEESSLKNHRLSWWAKLNNNNNDAVLLNDKQDIIEVSSSPFAGQGPGITSNIHSTISNAPVGQGHGKSSYNTASLNSWHQGGHIKERTILDYKQRQYQRQSKTSKSMTSRPTPATTSKSRASKSMKSKPMTMTKSPTAQYCFPDRDTIKSAVDSYIIEGCETTNITCATRTQFGGIGTWCVKFVTDMSGMFADSSSFNSDLSKWDVGSVTFMDGMFYGASSFNSNISNWNVGRVTSMNSMFGSASSFGSDISLWDVSSVTNMIATFVGASSFNSSISNWDVSSVTNMVAMFAWASSFNSDISLWNVGSVTIMDQMFLYASSFNSEFHVGMLAL